MDTPAKVRIERQKTGVKVWADGETATGKTAEQAVERLAKKGVDASNVSGLIERALPGGE